MDVGFDRCHLDGMRWIYVQMMMAFQLIIAQQYTLIGPYLIFMRVVLSDFITQRYQEP
jgi:hypothetical protein